MASELKAQEFVHSLEHGKGRWWVMLGLVIVLAALLGVCFLFTQVFRSITRGDTTALFKGISHAKGMEQACIARELARGNGFSTKVIKPAAIEMFDENMNDPNYFAKLVKGTLQLQGISPEELAKLSPDEKLKYIHPQSIPDIYHAPLNPWINSLGLRVMVAMNNSFKWHRDDKGNPDFWTFSQGEVVHIADKVIGGVAILLLYGAIFLNYLTLSWLFDRRLAVLMVVITLTCQLFWDFATTGLPQLLLLFLFSGATLCLTRALMAKSAGGWTWPWIAGMGLCLGLMALAHGIALWLLLGATIYVGVVFRPYGRDAVILLAICGLVYSPWLARNARVCGKATGLGWVTKLYQIKGTESQIMRTLGKGDDNVEPSNYTTKVLGQTISQLDELFSHFGKVPTTLFFFLALLHAFRKPETRSLRWGLLWMWLSAVLGMSVFGYSDYELQANMQSNDIHLIFIPLFAAYGLALLLNLWSRVEVDGRPLSTLRFAHVGMTTLILLASAFPMLSRFISPQETQVVFPPYYPPYIAKLSDWYNENEVICSDMPWAVAWYADRRSLWLPYALRDFNTLNNFTFNGKITGLFLTPVTGFRGLLNDIGNGEYREWALFIMRDPHVSGSFPLSVIYPNFSFGRAGVPYWLYSDRDRWTERQ